MKDENAPDTTESASNESLEESLSAEFDRIADTEETETVDEEVEVFEEEDEESIETS